MRDGGRLLRRRRIHIRASRETQRENGVYEISGEILPGREQDDHQTVGDIDVTEREGVHPATVRARAAQVPGERDRARL